MNFTILNSHVAVIRLRFIKNTYFYVKKLKKLMTELAFFKQENCYNKITSVRKSYISKICSKRKLKSLKLLGVLQRI